MNMNNELAPIIVFAYNRPEHLRQTLEALSKNDLASESVLYIYCDGAKPLLTEDDKELEGATNTAKRFFKGTEIEYEKYLSDIEENRRVAHSATGFKEVRVIVRPHNVGLKDNIVGAVTEIVNQYGKVIVLEDDMITSLGTLRYFNDALETYKNDERVMHVVSYMFPHKYPLPKTFFYTVPYPGGGWATWQRAWKYYSDDITDLYNYWKDDWSYFNYWNHDGVDLVKQLIDNYNGTLCTWFVRWFAVMLRMRGLTLYPGKSLVTNIGFDGTGDNCFKLERNPYWVEHLADSIEVRHKKHIRENKWAAREIYAFHAGYWYNRRRRNKTIAIIKRAFKIDDK